MSLATTLKAFGVAQVIVTLKDVPPGDAAALDTAGSSVSSVTKHFRRSEDSRQGALAAATGRTRTSPPPYKVFKNLGLVLGTVDEKGYQGLRRSAAVKGVHEAPELSLIRPVAAAAVTPAKGPTWGVSRLKVDKLWAKGITGQGVVVGHLDTGVDGKHPALKGAIAKFAEFDEMGEQVSGATAHDSDEHGTHTAGTIVGRPVKGSQFGIAPGAKLASAMVIEGGNVIARVLAGMNWIVGEGAKILSMSLGLRGFRGEFLPVMQAIRNRGILPVIAVGNEGPGTSRSPGNYDIVLSIGASDAQERVADFSSSQRIVRPVDPRVPDVVAPGVGVLSALPRGDFGKLDGSSMATPHIAGLAALLWQAKPGASVNEIEAAIFGSCKRPATMLQSRVNRGVPDAVEALRLLLAGTSTGAARKPRKAAKRTKAKRKKKTRTR